MHWRRYLDDPALAEYAAREQGPTRMLVRRGYEAWVERLGLAGGEPEAAGRVEGGRQPHPVVELPGGERVVVRRYLRGGAVRHLNRSRYLLGHRAFDELRATERARSAGVRVPEGIAASERRAAPGYTAVLATRWVPEARELHAWLPGHEEGERRSALREAGRQVALLHAGGIAHPDLNLRNLLVAPPGPDGVPALILLDFDRARLHGGPVPAARRARDLRRLARSARKLGAPVSAGGWDAFREGYGADWPLRSPLG